MRPTLVTTIGAAVTLGSIAAGVALAADGTTERVSVGPGAAQATGLSANPALSAEGRHVAFASLAPNLVAGDANGLRDVFLRDRTTNVTELASVSATGGPANGVSTLPAISADGRNVAFESTADNLVPGDANGAADIFLRDRVSGTTERVSINALGGEANAPSSQPALAGDRFVAFASAATNLAPNDRNGAVDVFVRDRVAGVTERVSVSAGPQGQANGLSAKPAISADGRYVAFTSVASNLVSGDTNQSADVFVRDRQAGSTTRVSVGADLAEADGGSAGAAISTDGRYVAFASLATNLVDGDANDEADVFVHDREAGTTQRVSVVPSGAEADGPSVNASISGDGNVVSFESGATNLVVSDTNGRGDVFVRDLPAGVTERISIDSAGAQARKRSGNAAISQEGFAVAFESLATNLVDADTNAKSDAFVRERPRPTVGQDVSVVPTRGKVLISLPPKKGARSSAAVPGIKGRKFVSLTTVQRLPVGSLVDVRKGALKLTSARNSKGASQTAEFSAGVFQVLQSRKRSSRGLTELRLKGSSFASCATGKSRGAQAQASRRRRIRRLSGNAMAASARAAATPRRPCGARNGPSRTAATARSPRSSEARCRCVTSAAERRSSFAPASAISPRRGGSAATSREPVLAVAATPRLHGRDQPAGWAGTRRRPEEEGTDDAQH